VTIWCNINIFLCETNVFSRKGEKMCFQVKLR